MGFSKAHNKKEISIVVTHPMHPGDRYVFTFPKTLPQAALDAQGRFLGLPDTARAEEWRTALVATVAEMVIREPEGFDDFQRLTDEDRAAGMVNQRPLAERFVEYFNDAEQPELEAIIVQAWKEYKAAAVPAAYVKSPEDSGAPGGESSGVPSTTPPVV